MKTNRWRRWIIVPVIAGLFIVPLYPLPVRQQDQELVIARSARRLRNQQSVWLDLWYQPFYDAGLIAERNPKWNLVNTTELNCDALERDGFKPMREAEVKELFRGSFYEEGNVLVEVTWRDWKDRPGPRQLRFNVYHGPLVLRDIA